MLVIFGGRCLFGQPRNFTKLIQPKTANLRSYSFNFDNLGCILGVIYLKSFKRHNFGLGYGNSVDDLSALFSVIKKILLKKHYL